MGKIIYIILILLIVSMTWRQIGQFGTRYDVFNMIEGDIHKPEKMLSHRLRGFSTYEHTKQAFLAALKSNVAYLEIDTRVSLDGKIYVYHDYRTDHKILGRTLVFANTSSALLDQLKYPNGQMLLSFESLLDAFSKHPDDGKKLCIDIKDFGFEQQHFAQVKKYQLQDRVIWVSWMPQSLIELHCLSPEIPLFLSHWNLIRFGMAGEWLENLVKGSMVEINSYVSIGKDLWNTPLEDRSHGFQHAYFVTKLPEGLLEIISSSGGGICVHKSVLDKKLIKYCTNNNLRIMVFSVDKLYDYNKLSEQNGVDVIFCDATIGRGLSEQISRDL